jgi:hypothetical protein
VVGTEATLVQHWGGSRYLPKPKRACLQCPSVQLGAGGAGDPAQSHDQILRPNAGKSANIPGKECPEFLGRPCPIRGWAYQERLRALLVVICPKIQRGRQINELSGTRPTRQAAATTSTDQPHQNPSPTEGQHAQRCLQVFQNKAGR